MKPTCLTLFGLIAGLQLASAQTALVNFNSADTNGVASDITASPDANGNYWNNILAAQNGETGGAVSLNGGAQPVALVDTANKAVGWKLAIHNTTGWNASAAGFGNYDGPYPDAVTNFPATALRNGMHIGGDGVTVTLSGLDPGSAYNVLTYGATGSSFLATNAQTDTLTVGTCSSAAAVSFNALNNATTAAAWTKVAPSAGGQIVITIAAPAGGMLNFMQVSKVGK